MVLAWFEIIVGIILAYLTYAACVSIYKSGLEGPKDPELDELLEDIRNRTETLKDPPEKP